MTTKSKKKNSEVGAVKNTAKNREKIFIDAYLSNNMNATKACIIAGYSEKGARVQGTRMLAKPNIKKAIEEEQSKLSRKLTITRDSLLDDIQFAKDIASNTLDKDYPQFQAYLKSIEMQAKILGLNEPDKIDIQGQLRVTSSRGAFADR